MGQQAVRDSKSDEIWQSYFHHGYSSEERKRRFFRYLPTSPRCKKCYVPFKGIGGTFARLVLNKKPSPHNPLLCNACEEFANRHPGGVEVEMAMLFADVRGSTALAETMTPAAFSALINRFYNVSIKILAEHDALIDRLVGDEMIGYFLPYMAEPNRAVIAIRAAQALLHATGHNRPEGPWIPVGIGVHVGVAYFGTVGTKDGMMDLTVLGNPPNTTARLAGVAGPGEILVSERAALAAGFDFHEAENRILNLKGVSEPVSVHVIHAGEGMVLPA